ncbi:CCR4-NOT transcription complex subunit 7 [Linum perenne]
MAKSCHGICDMEIGLQRLADLLNIKREGEAHQAGSDSLLTALAYSEMRRRFQIHQGAYMDYLYGITERIGRTPLAFQVQLDCVVARCRYALNIFITSVYSPVDQQNDFLIQNILRYINYILLTHDVDYIDLI